jgi:hypothetical protein
VSEQRILKISVTELQEYWRCHRQWDIGSANRQSLVKKGKPATALWMGSAVHVALAANIDGKNAKEAFDEYVAALRVDIAREYALKVGAPMSTQEWVEFDTSVKLAEDVLANYFALYGTTDTFRDKKLTAVASEMTFIIPLDIPLAPTSRYFDEVWLVGTIDAALLSEGGRLWIADHKTFSQRPSLADLQLDHQFVGYSACMQSIVKQPVEGFVYNGINKKVPIKPRVLIGEGPNKGKLSKEWVDTTTRTYLEAMREIGAEETDPYYAPHLARLRERDLRDNPFFIRHRINVPQAAIASWWTNAIDTITEMANDPTITYNRAWTGCWDCGVRDLCDAMIRGDDVEWVKQNYTIGTYGTQRTLANTVSPETVDSLDDLIALLNRQAETSDSTR